MNSEHQKINQDISNIIKQYPKVTCIKPDERYPSIPTVLMPSSGIEPLHMSFYTRKSKFKPVEYKKVVCIDNEGENTLELNKIYYADVLEKSRYYSKLDLESSYFIFAEPADETLIGSYHRNRFITIAEWRDRQIDIIIE